MDSITSKELPYCVVTNHINLSIGTKVVGVGDIPVAEVLEVAKGGGGISHETPISPIMM